MIITRIFLGVLKNVPNFIRLEIASCGVPFQCRLASLDNNFRSDRQFSELKQINSGKGIRETELKQNVHEYETIAFLMDMLSCQKSTAQQIFDEVPELKNADLADVKSIVNILLSKKVTVASIVENPFLLITSADDVKIKLPILLSMDPVDINDFIPLLRLRTKQLTRLETLYKNDLKNKELQGRHRIYYFSKEFEAPPKIVAKQFCTHMTMFFSKIDTAKAKIDLYKKFKVPPANILRDLKCLTLSVSRVSSRLELLSDTGVEKIMPWMVKCNQCSFHETLRAWKNFQKIPEDSEDTIKLYNDSIGLDEEKMQSLLKKYPKLLRYKKEKISDIVEYILDETTYTAHDIAQHPWIFYTSLEKIKKRVTDMQELGYSSQNINMLQCSDKEYKQYLKQMSLSHHKIVSITDFNLSPHIQEEKSQLLEILPTKMLLTEIIRELLPECDASNSRILDGLPDIYNISLDLVETNIKFLKGREMEVKTMEENPFLLVQRPGVLGLKLRAIEAMKQTKIEDFIPLMILPLSQLIKIRDLSREEADLIPRGGRIYYFSEVLKVEPATVSRHFASNTFLLSMKWSILEPKLKLFLDYNIEPSEILGDLTVLSKPKRIIEKRLKYLRAAGIDTIVSCMFEYDESELKELIGGPVVREQESRIQENIDYLTNNVRLNQSTISRIKEKYPQILRNKNSQLRDVVNYLLIETKYSIKDIMSKPMILVENVATLRKRMEELNAIGHLPKVNVICLPEDVYRLYVTNIKNQKDEPSNK